MSRGADNRTPPVPVVSGRMRARWRRRRIAAALLVELVGGHEPLAPGARRRLVRGGGPLDEADDPADRCEQQEGDRDDGDPERALHGSLGDGQRGLRPARRGRERRRACGCRSRRSRARGRSGSRRRALRAASRPGRPAAATVSRWCLAMTASRSGFGMPKRFVLPSAARPYIVSITDSIFSAGRTSTLKLTSSSVLFQKLCDLAGLDRDDVAGPGLDLAAVDLQGQRALRDLEPLALAGMDVSRRQVTAGGDESLELGVPRRRSRPPSSRRRAARRSAGSRLSGLQRSFLSPPCASLQVTARGCDAGGCVRIGATPRLRPQGFA